MQKDLNSDLIRARILALPYQDARLRERRLAQAREIRVLGTPFIVFPGVYDCGGDTQLMIETVRIGKDDLFLDVGCGAGVVSVCLAAKSAGGVGVDVNQTAIENARCNAQLHDVTNVTFECSDVFDSVQGEFEVIVCNPPYSSHPAADNIERMFWDPGNGMTKRVFAEATKYLRSDGCFYFGWSDFGDIYTDLPMVLARSHGFRCESVESRKMGGGRYRYLVFAFRQS